MSAATFLLCVLVGQLCSISLCGRVCAKDCIAFGAENPIPDAHQTTWRLLSAEIERDDGARVDVELLRPVAWIEEQGFTNGARIYLRLEELNVAGWATIRGDPCPTLSNGHGNLVTGRFITRGATKLAEATFSDGQHNKTVLNGTSIHPVWSPDRMDWVPLGELAIDEQVYSNDGPLQLIARIAHNQPTDVYNIEVDCEHVYQVGNAGILVHNTCDTNMMGRIGERLAADVLQKRGWTILGGLSRGNNGLDLIVQKNIGGKLQTLLIEVKVNGSRLSELQNLGLRRYAEDVLRRFTDAGLANRTLVQNLIDSGTEIRGIVIRMDWRSGDLIEKLRRWYN